MTRTTVDPLVVSEDLTPDAGGGAPATWPGLRAHLREPFFRNAYALVMNTGATSALGIVYWALAAKNYEAFTVGQNSAVISVMTLLSGLLALNIAGTLARFLPQAGADTGRFIGYAHTLSCVVVVVVTLGFLLTQDRWGTTFGRLQGGLPTALGFTAVVIVAAVFTLQDGILPALRGSVWVPVKNAVFGAAKIALLVVFATRIPRDGIYLSWVLPMAAVVVPTTVLIVARLVPRHVRTTSGRYPPLSLHQVRRFFFADYLGALCVFSTVQLVPVMVAAEVQPHEFAYFYIVWIVVGALDMVAVNIATSLTVESTFDSATLTAHCRAAVGRTLGLLLVAYVALAVGAPYALRAFDLGYSLVGGPLIQLLALASIPRGMTEVYIGAMRAQNRTSSIVRVQVLRGVVVLVSIFLGLKALGVIGIGVGALVGQVVVGLVIAPGLWRVLVPGRRRRQGPDDGHEPDTVELPLPLVPAQLPESSRSQASFAGRPGASWRPRPGQVKARLRAGVAPVRSTAVVCSIVAVGLACYLVPLGTVDPDRLTGYGLISVLPTSTLVGVAILAIAFVLTLSLAKPHRLLLGTQVVLMVCCLHGITVLVEPLPRFAEAWAHIGFVDYIARTGTTASGLDARFSWPGFFALVGLLLGSGDWHLLVPVIRLAPIVNNLLFLVPLALILRNMRANWRAKWFAAWLFGVLNWVSQDYFSPQAFAYLLFLMFLAVLLTWFRPVTPTGTAAGPRAGLGRRLAALAGPLPGENPVRTASATQRAGLLALVLVLSVVVTASHQLTPVVMITVCAGLVLVRRCTLSGLPVIIAVVVVAWVSYFTEPYWSGHLDVMLGGVGRLGANLTTSLGDRTGSADPQHLAVLYARIAFAVGLFLLAGLGALRRRLRGVDDRVALVVLLAPFLMLALQSYGGEVVLRVYFFALPAACLFVAYLIFPEIGVGAVSIRRTVAAGVLGVVFVLSFFLTRYGNERFEYVRPGEVAVVDGLFADNAQGFRLMWMKGMEAEFIPSTPSRFEDFERVRYVARTAPSDPGDVAGVVEALRALGPDSYLITTRSNEARLELIDRYPAKWGERFRARMESAPGIRVVAANDDAVVFAAQRPAPAPTVEQPFVRGVRVGVSPLTPVGGLFVVSLLAVLAAREFWRLRLPDRAGTLRLRPLTLAAVPLCLGMVAVVMERFITLS